MIIFFLLFCVVYFIPTIIVAFKKSTFLPFMFVFNLAMGWTIFGWIAFLLMSIFMVKSER